MSRAKPAHRTPPFDGKTPKERGKAAENILAQMHRVGAEYDAGNHSGWTSGGGSCGWAFMLGAQLQGLMRIAYDASNLVARTRDRHPQAKQRNRAAEEADRELVNLSDKVWAMPVRAEQDLVNRAWIADYASPPDTANAQLITAVLVRNGHVPGSWGPARGKRSIAAARGQPVSRPADQGHQLTAMHLH